MEQQPRAARLAEVSEVMELPEPGARAFWRLQTTGLSDAALVLFDSPFDGSAPLRLLASKDFREIFTRGYEHGPSVSEVRHLLDDLARDGLVRIESGERGESACLTRMGGALWERERRPDWAVYYTASELPHEVEPTSLLEVTAVDGAVGEDVLSASFDCGVFARLEDAPMQFEWQHDAALTPWKRSDRWIIRTTIGRNSCWPDWRAWRGVEHVRC
jgi:hypothetical protein